MSESAGEQDALSPELLLRSVADSPGDHEWTIPEGVFESSTRLGAFPPVSHGPAQSVFAAVSEHTATSVALFQMPETIKIDQETRDALAVASPGAFRDGWGAGFRTIWANLGREGSRRVIKLQGTLETGAGEKVVLSTWTPSETGHWVVIAITRPEAASELGPRTRALLSIIPGEPQSTRGTDWAARVVPSVGLTLVVLLAVLGIWFARRRRASSKVDQLSARTSGSEP